MEHLEQDIYELLIKIQLSENSLDKIFLESELAKLYVLYGKLKFEHDVKA